MRFTSHDSTELAYESVGTGPPLLCCPGGPGMSAAYFGDLAGLSSLRTLILMDPRGSGRSDLPADPASMRFDRLAADIEALRTHLGLETLDVLGHSAGAVTAQAWASQHPVSVGRLLLLTPSDHLQGGARSDVPAIRESFADQPWYAEAVEAAAALQDAPDSQRAALTRATRPFHYSHWDAAAQEHAARSEAMMSKRAQLGYITGVDQVDIPALVAGLRAVTAPVLVVVGTRDAVSGRASGDIVQGSFDAATLAEVEGAGHHPWLDEPAAFRAAVDGFVS